MLRASYRFVVAAMALGLGALPQTAANAQGESAVSVTVYSSPPGASVVIDGKVTGVTPLKLNLLVGMHTFRYTLPGFIEKVETKRVETGTEYLGAVLEGGQDFTELPGDPLWVTWSNNGRKVRFVITDYQTGKPVSTAMIYDMDRKSVASNAPPIDTLEDATIRNRLGAVSRLFTSPSARYAAYTVKDPPSKDPLLWQPGSVWLKIADLSANRVWDPGVLFPTSDDDLFPPFHLTWSPNETIVGVERNEFGLAEFLLLENDLIKRVAFPIFKTTEGQEVNVEKQVGRPTDQKSALIQGFIEAPPRFWLVDLQTEIGKPLPIEYVFTAGFSPDGKSICVIHKGGISRLSLDLKTVELVSDMVSARWGVYQASLSPTLEYVLIAAGNPETARFWIYKMPRC